MAPSTGALSPIASTHQDGSLTPLKSGGFTRRGAGLPFSDAGDGSSSAGVANYVSGSVAAFPVDSEGKLGPASSVQQDVGPAGAAKPAAAVEGSFAISDHNGPHAHMIASDPSGKFVFSTDLGLDRIYQWRFDAASGKLTPNDPPWIAASSAGAGPRHFIFHPNGKIVLLINEEGIYTYQLPL
ncbi:6-phosphogluconolactonase [Serratia fonticola]|uniref:6-phosphogluconolactonase n=1 Tax=Serratia fonticola TaxID=47917 RepID=A0A4U9W999_SERFO|nr:6-phosphogluconolactonase [Serratia fonticola]